MSRPMRRRHTLAGSRPWLAPLVCSLAAAAAVGAFAKPPSEVDATVQIAFSSPERLATAHVPSFPSPSLAGASFHANREGASGDGWVTATRGTGSAALAAALSAAHDYVRELTARRDRWLRDHRNDHPKAHAALLAKPGHYEFTYNTPAQGAGAASPSLRAALIGLLVAGIVAALLATRLESTPAIATPDGGSASVESRAPPTVAAIAAAVLSALLIWLSSHSGPGAYTFLLIALLGALAFVYALRGGRPAIRTIVIAVIAVAPLRGGLLALANAVDLPNPLLTANAIQPAVIAGAAAAVLLAHRSLLRDQPRVLRVGWATIVAVAVIDLASQTVGLKLYAIGFAQYVVYPTFAVLAWPVLDQRDRERLIFALAGLGVLVAISIFLEAAGVPFVEAVRAPAPGGGIRYGGATGSYLHASIFLGTTAVLAAGVLLSRWSRAHALIGTVALGVIVAGLSLTYSRGGAGIAAIGGATLLIVLRGVRTRVVLVAVAAVAVAIGLALSDAIGPSPSQLAARASSGTSIHSDPGNQLRIDAMRDAIDDYKRLPAVEKAIGQGLASTGNAGKLASLNPNPTESYPLKLLLEVGIVGLLAIGAIIVWAGIRFLILAWRASDPVGKGVGAAGIGLSADALAYPTLEVQLVALLWWLLVVLCLPPPDAEAKGTGFALDDPLATKQKIASADSAQAGRALAGDHEA